MPAKKKQQTNSPEQKLIAELKKQIETLEKQLKIIEAEKTDQDEMVKRAQYDYINLKMDFDRYQKTQESNVTTQKRDLQIASVKKFLPFVETMRKSLEALDKEQKKTSLAEGVSLMYKNFLNTLESMNITPIEALGLDPDTYLHEPVGMQPTEDKKLKGKIIQEFERGFVYSENGEKTVITTSKVVIGQ